MNLNPIQKNVSPDVARQESRDFPNLLLSVREAARFLGLSASYLNKRRGTGDGPRFVKLGSRVLYDVPDLQEWLAARKRKSTSE